MGKASKVKQELSEAIEMTYLIQTLKDIADNKYFTLVNNKDTFRRFGESFVEFFRMISLTKAEHPMIANNNPITAIVVITIEGSFLGEFNNRIVRRAFKEKEKAMESKFIAVGEKPAEQLQKFTPDLKVFPRMENFGIYETAVAVKDYLVDEIMNERIGKVVACYSWPKDFETQKVRSRILLPCEDLVSKQAQYVNVFEEIIEESDPREVIGKLAQLWITTRLYEMFIDTLIASAAAQAAFLEESIDRMKKEQNKTKLKFRKAKKSDIDKGLRETYTARMMTMK